ncbi:PREDICTED: uncharacterized protein LOC109183326 [Ipomoea nil]|uniref:uncharacterized protein LOC109183326 n=1 Tax=Ipomoea nil TaxID=35883 RepID=UPI0009010D74|nr:PREDICTED: uncharacterized protein LOC109183326 [Ipomoea nil]
MGEGRQVAVNTTAHSSNAEGKLINSFYRCLGIARGRAEKLQQMTHVIEEFEATLCEEEEDGAAENAKRVIMEAYYGVLAPETIKVHPPTVVKTKGSCKRMKSAKEVALTAQVKKNRTCKTCGLASGHNSRSCPQ